MADARRETRNARRSHGSRTPQSVLSARAHERPICDALARMNQLSSVRRRPAARAPVIPPASDRVRRVIVAGLLVTIAIVVLQAASQVIDFSVFNLRLQALNSDKHYSVFGVASLLAQAAVAAASGWRGSRVERHRWAWFALGALVAGLVLVRGLTTFNAAALAVPLACVLLLLCWLTWRDPGAARAVVWAGLILMATSLAAAQSGARRGLEHRQRLHLGVPDHRHRQARSRARRLDAAGHRNHRGLERRKSPSAGVVALAMGSGVRSPMLRHGLVRRTEP